jgi:hypothetical protein
VAIEMPSNSKINSFSNAIKTILGTHTNIMVEKW